MVVKQVGESWGSGQHSPPLLEDVEDDDDMATAEGGVELCDIF